MTLIKGIPDIKRVLLISLIVYLVAAYFSVGYYHDDEHFQIFEFAGLKYGINKPADLAWEYPLRMRSAIQPAIAYAVHETFNLLNLANPFHEATFLRFLSVILSLISTILLIKAFTQKITDEIIKKWFIWLSFLIWFIVYKNVRFSSENWSSHFFIIGLAVQFLNNEKKKYKYFITGLFWGFAFLFRFQTGIMIAGALLWLLFINKEQVIKMMLIISGILLIIFIGVLIDKWYYEEWTLSAYHYFIITLFKSNISISTQDPWWFYLKQGFIKAIPPFSLVYVLSIIIVFIFRFKNILTWIFLPFILIHIYIPHKELRFLFPLINFIPLFIIQAIEVIKSSNKEKLMNIISNKWVTNSFWYANILCLIIICIKPAANNIAVYEKIYNSYNKPAVLFYIEENPFGKNRFINFYKRSNLEVIKINKIEDLKIVNRKNIVNLFIAKNSFREAEMNADTINYKKIYTRFPVWLNHFNYKGWINKKRNWTIYEIKS